jgi:outer membrane protein X
MSLWDLSLNVHYLIPIADKASFYPLVGVGLLNVRVDFDDLLGGLAEAVGYEDELSYSETKVGFNVGAGFDYRLADNVIANIEAKYKIAKDLNRTIVSIGIAYKF